MTNRTAHPSKTRFNLLRYFSWTSAVVILLVFILTGIVTTFVMHETHLRMEQREAANISHEIIEKLEAVGHSRNDWENTQISEAAQSPILQELKNLNVQEFDLISKRGKILSAMRSVEDLQPSELQKDRVHMAINGQIGAYWESENLIPFLFSPEAREGWIETYVPVRQGDSIVGVARVRRDLSSTVLNGHQMLPQVMLLATAGAFGVFMILWLIIRRADQLICAQRGEIELANKQLEENNDLLRKLNFQKDEFLAICSHDIRSPLASVSAGCQLLLNERRGSLNEDQRQIVERSARSIKTIVNLTNSLLDLARIEAGQETLDLEYLNFLGVIEESIADQRPEAEKRRVVIKMVAHSVQNDFEIEADRLKLLRVCNNLISNAVKHSPPDSVVIIQAERAGNAICIAVTDHGPGIAPEDLKGLFDRFCLLAKHRRTREEGTGLGLSITRALVALHGGRIDVAATPGKGATFKVTFPVKPKEANQLCAAAATRLEVRTPSVRWAPAKAD